MSPPQVKKAQFGSTDPECFTEHMSMISDDLRLIHQGPSNFECAAQVFRLPRCAIFTMDWKGAEAFMSNKDGLLGWTIATRGGFKMKEHSHEDTYGGDLGHVVQPNRPFDLRSQESHLLCGAFYAPLLKDFYNKVMAYDPARPVEWAKQFNLQTKEAGTFYRFLRFVWNENNRSDSCLDQSFVVQEIENTLMALFAQAIGPSGSESIQKTFRKADGHHIRQAEDYIEQSLGQPFSLADLAVASGTSLRSLTRKFQDRFGMSPMSFVKQRRLERVRSELQATDAKETTVHQIALQYGFHHLSQFAKDYKDTFGESPSVTLQKIKS